MNQAEYEPFNGPQPDEDRRIHILNKIIYYTNAVFIFIMFWFSVVSISYLKPVLQDSQSLLNDASMTIYDFGELIPEVNESLKILKTLCNSKNSPIHEWCHTDHNTFYENCNITDLKKK
jgi:hypothetical protein